MKLLVNYASAKFRASQRLNGDTGIALGKFDNVVAYSRRDIDARFGSRHRQILKYKTGDGYWLWKPYFIQKSLALLADGDFLFYSDSGARFIASIDPLIELCKKQNQDVIPFELQHLERAWTKRDAFILLGCDADKFANSRQRLASFMLIRKSKFAVAFVDEYLSCASDPRAITDQENTLGERNHDDFVAHRHDQSVFSLLTKKHELTGYRDPSQWGNKAMDDYPTSTYGQLIDHTRKRTSSVIGKLWYSLDRSTGTLQSNPQTSSNDASERHSQR